MFYLRLRNWNKNLLLLLVGGIFKRFCHLDCRVLFPSSVLPSAVSVLEGV